MITSRFLINDAHPCHPVPDKMIATFHGGDDKVTLEIVPTSQDDDKFQAFCAGHMLLAMPVYETVSGGVSKIVISWMAADGGQKNSTVRHD